MTSEGGLGNPSAVTLMGLSRMMPLDTAEEDAERELATLSSARIGPPGTGTVVLAALEVGG